MNKHIKMSLQEAKENINLENFNDLNWFGKCTVGLFVYSFMLPLAFIVELGFKHEVKPCPSLKGNV